MSSELSPIGHRLGRLFAEVRSARTQRAPAEEIRRARQALLEASKRQRREGMLPHLQRCLVPEKALRVFRSGYAELPGILGVREWQASQKSICILAGDVGTGKTVAACYALSRATRKVRTMAHPLDEEMLELEELDWRRGLFVTAAQLKNAPQHNWQAKQDAPRGARPVSVAAVLEVDVLVLDELAGETKDTRGEWMERLNDVLGRRHAACKRTVITSNIGQEALSEWVGERLADRFAEEGVPIEFSGPSLRRKEAQP